jgi:hypothetical protein
MTTPAESRQGLETSRGAGQRRPDAWSAALAWPVSLLRAPAIFLLAWLASGADTEGPDAGTNHWAYRPLAAPPTPAVRNHGWVQAPVDAFILSALEARRLAPASPAGKRTWLRRVYFDLIGLPPSPEAAEAFLADRSRHARQTVVDSLLASPRYGERWARHWMDAAHFAETHGHDQDRIRTNAWPYRDYLIASFNVDKPYARFVQEQVAGDVLFPDDPQGTVALGFLAAGPWDESSLRDIREDTLDRQIARYLDRDDTVTTVMQTFVSTTIQCARCHHHKFDPIPQQDYYALQAVFAGVDRANRVYDEDPRTHRRRQELLALRRRVESGDRALLLDPVTQREVGGWERKLAASRTEWQVLVPEVFSSTNGSTLAPQPGGSLLVGGPRPERDVFTITVAPPPGRLAAVRLEALSHESLPKGGPGRQDNGNLHLSQFQLFLADPGKPDLVELPLTNPRADFEQDGWTIAHALDQDEKTAWGIYPRVGQSHQAIFELKEPFTPARGAKLVVVLKQLHGGGHLIGHARLSATSVSAAAFPAVLPPEIEQALGVAPQQRIDQQWAALGGFYLKEKVAHGLAALPKPSLVYAAAADFEADGGLKPAGRPRPVQVLRRGEITRPLEPASAGALACVGTLPARFVLSEADNEGERRAALARWLTHRDNPLVWRSIVNRVWHYHFGRGLVDTPNDFGRMGGVPSHPELLDWLAVWFRDQARGSLKQLHRLIVLSAVYGQSSAPSPPNEGRPRAGARPSAGGPQRDSSKAGLDPDNRLLRHMNRTRLDAEQVRDAILQIAGCLDLRMGGPSDRHFDLQPGIHVTPQVDYTKFDVDSATGRRRGVYRFLFRTLPDPFMDALDCPAGDQPTPTRNAGVTVQQALALWNNAFVARHAEHLAGRVERECRDLHGQVDRAFALVLGRPCTRAERRDFAAYIRRHGLANACRVLFNSSEFMFVN